MVMIPATMEASDCLAALRAVGLELNPGTVRPIEGGWSFWTFRAGDLIVRFARTGNDAAGLEREFALLPLLRAELPVPVPTYCVRGVSNGSPFGAYPALSGEPLVDGAPAHLWTALGQALRDLHALPLSRVEPLIRGSRADDVESWEELRQVTRPHLPEALGWRIESLITSYLDASRDCEVVLTHNDLGLVHVLAEGGRIGGIIDWTDACVGDPAKDFAGILAQAGEEALRATLAAYGTTHGSFERRVRFFACVAPLHDITYGLATRQDDIVRAGVDGVAGRMRRFGEPGL